MRDSTLRFSDRTADYAKYRPTYPQALVDDLSGLAWTRESVAADVGAGTGLFTRLVAARTALVYALEPNGPMRDQGQADSLEFSNILWSGGSAEATGLPGACLDALVCAQAFHWFEPAATAAEWRRILRPGAAVVLVWNDRDPASPLHADYQALVERWCPEYPRVNHRNITPERIEAFFAPRPVTRLERPNDQRFDLEAWKGRLRSSSYTPAPGAPGHRELMEGLAVLFDRYRDADGLVTFPYRTTAWVGRLN